jgi:hypothetical protein
MIDLGVATSIAKDNHFSWQDTVDYARKQNLNSIQYYVPQNKILPITSNLANLENTYLHLPIDYDSKTEELILFSKDFKSNYNSNKLIFHQKESLVFQKTKEVIEKFNQAGFLVGVENEGSKDLNSYYELVNFLSESNVKFYAVLDIHRFYCNYSDKFENELIFEMICKLIDFCSKSGIKIVMHIIDSKSFKINRDDWVPLFEGIVPYPQLLNYISKMKITIESIIFEYEATAPLTNSLENLKNFDYNYNKIQSER